MTESEQIARNAEIARTVLEETNRMNRPEQIIYQADKVAKRFAARRRRAEKRGRQR